MGTQGQTVQGAQGGQGYSIQGAAGANGQSIHWMGSYGALTNYVAYDAVSYQGTSYLAIASSTGQTPSSSPSYWSVLAAQGSQGTYGSQGIQGLNTSTNVMAFAAAGTYVFDFTTSNAGTTITVIEPNKRIQPFNNSSEDLASTAAANLAVTTSYFSTSAAETATLAAGVNGQIKTFAMYADSGDMVITVTNAAWGGSGTITFSAVGQACTLQYINSRWFCMGNNGASFA